MRVAIRVDGGTRIGTGHVMRCLALANALRPHPVTFVCRAHPGHLAARIEAQGHACHLLPAPQAEADDPDGPRHAGWLGAPWQVDAAETAAAIAGAGGAELLIVDHYGIDRRWESRLRGHGKRLMAIDDLADREHDADVLLDQNFGAEAAAYRPLVPESCRLLTGPDWALLRPEFAAARAAALRRRHGLTSVRSLLITLGGTDTRALEAKVLRLLARAGGRALERVVLVDGADAAAESLACLMQADGLAGTVLARADDMAALMAEADVAIGAGGSTTWERCCLGLPTLQLTIAENQSVIGERLLAHGAIVGLVRPDEIGVGDIEALLALDRDSYALIAGRAAAVCDGQGTGRVAAELLR